MIFTEMWGEWLESERLEGKGRAADDGREERGNAANEVSTLRKVNEIR
jgi:hypothetical protein